MSGEVPGLEILLMAVTLVLAIMNPVSTAAVFPVLTVRNAGQTRKI